MKKIIFTFMLLLSCESLLSQEHPNYFPLAVGNRWEYMKLGNASGRLVMTIMRDKIMDNGKQYYIFEYNLPHEYLSSYPYTKYFFTPLDPVQMYKNGDIYGYDDALTQNEYIYSLFSEHG